MAVQLGWDSGNLWGIPGSSPKTELVELRAGRLGLSCCRVCGAAELSFTQLCGVAIKRGVKVKTFSWSCGSPQLVAPPTRGDFVVGRRREEFGGGIRNAGRGSAALASTELLQDVSQPVSSSPQFLIVSSFQLRSNSFCLFFLRENLRFFCISLYYFSAAGHRQLFKRNLENNFGGKNRVGADSAVPENIKRKVWSRTSAFFSAPLGF